MKPVKTVLVLRMSALGDLLLSTAFLENLPPGVGVDWIVTTPFAFVLEGHPRIRKLYLYDKKTGLRGWIKLMRELSREQHDARIDLHGTLRSAIARAIFFLAGKPMRKINKQRVRTFLYFMLKRLTPTALRPTPYWQRFSEMGLRITRSLGLPSPVGPIPVAGQPLHPPRYPLDIEDVGPDAILAAYQLESKKFIVVMPASRWASKEWGSERYFHAVRELRAAQPELSGFPVLVCGRETDRACRDLLQRLHDAQIPARSALHENEFRITAFLLQNALIYLGGDTGLAHLAEAVGTPAVVVFGPTQPEVGFGPWRPESRAVCATVVCSPCSKDGRPCYRVGQPYECFRRIEPVTVAREVEQSIRESAPGLLSAAPTRGRSP
jgi:ADP-heptose:LPS heptosyltransferase